MTKEQVTEQAEKELYEEAAKEVFKGKEEKTPPEPKEEDLSAGSKEEPPENLPSEAPTETPPDPWEGVNPALRQTLESLNNTVAPLAERLKQAERRIGAMQNDYSAWKKEIEERVNSPSQEEIELASEDEDDWKALEEEYPDWTEAVQKKMQEIRDQHAQETQAALQQIQELKQQLQQSKPQGDTIDENLERRLLALKYPNYREIIADKDYQQWLVRQTQGIIQKTYSPVAEDAIAVLDAYTAYKQNRGKNDKKNRLQQAILPEGHDAVPPKSEEDMTEAEFRRKYAAELWGH